MNWSATQRRCDACGNSRIVVSENGFHSVCCLSEKKCMDCFMGKKDHYLGRDTNLKDRIAGEWEFTEKISYDTWDAPQTITWETPPPLTIEGELSIIFPDGREIKKPSPEEVLEWAKGTQISIYYVDESEDKE